MNEIEKFVKENIRGKVFYRDGEMWRNILNPSDCISVKQYDAIQLYLESQS